MSVFLIGLSGVAGSGKDSAGSYLKSKISNSDTIAFADEVKVHLSNMFDLDIDIFYNQNLKNKVIKTMPDLDGSFWTPRRLMQSYGQYMRSIDPDYWIKKVVDKIKNTMYNTIILTDARQYNEVRFILDHKGTYIKIERDIDDGELFRQDATEMFVNSMPYTPNYIIDNNSTIESLYKQLDTVLEEIHR